MSDVDPQRDSTAGHIMESPTEQNPYAAPQATLAASTAQEQRYLADEVEITPEFITAIQGGKDVSQAIYMQLMCSAIALAFTYVFTIVSVLATVIGYLVLIFLTLRGLYRLRQLPVSYAAKWFRRSLWLLYSFIPVYLLFGFIFIDMIYSERGTLFRYTSELGEVLHDLIGNFILTGAVYSALFGAISIGQFVNDRPTKTYGLIGIVFFSILFLGKIILMFVPGFKHTVNQAQDIGFDKTLIVTAVLYFGLIITFALYTAAAFLRPPGLIDELIRYEQAVVALPVAEVAPPEQA
jgi:hypothetical protein